MRTSFALGLSSLLAALASACGPSVPSYAIEEPLTDRRVTDASPTAPVAKAASASTSPSDEFLPEQQPAPLDGKRRTLPKATEARLSNGVRVVMVERHDFPAVSVGFVLDRGIASAAPGVAKLYASALFGASKDFESHDAYAYFGYVGAKPNSWAHSETIGFDVMTLSLLVGGPVTRVGSMFSTPRFESDDVTWARENLRAHQRAYREDPSTTASAVLGSMMFSSEHPYGRTTERLSDDRIKELTPADLVKFRDRYLGGDHVSVVVVGDFKKDAVLPRLERALAHLPRKADAPPVPPAPPPPSSARILVVDRKGASQSNVALGFPGIRQGDPAQPSVALLQSLLGRGLSGRLNIKTRGEHGSTYGVHVHNRAMRNAGVFEVDAAVDTPRTVETIRGLLNELKRMRTEPVAAEEFQRARANASDDLLDTENASDLLSAYETIAGYGLPIDYYETKSKEMWRLKPADIQAVSERILGTESVQIAIVGDASAIVGPLRELGIGEVVVRETPP